MPEEAAGWYEHIAESIEELRDELRIMEAAGATPEDFGLKVRSHPDTLVVTARNKMGSAQKVVVSIGLATNFIETSTLKNEEAALAANRAAATRLAKRLEAEMGLVSHAEPVAGGFLLRDVPVGPILDFLAEFQNHPRSMITASGPVRRYIEARQHSELGEWDVLLTSTQRSDAEPLIDESLGRRITCQRRAAGDNSNAVTLLITNKQRVASRGVEKTGLTADEVREAEEAFLAEPENAGKWDGKGKTPNFPDRIYRRVRKKPLFILHLLAIGEKGEDLSGNKPVVAWSISFPATETHEEHVEYIVDTVWMRDNFRDEADEDEMRGDDE